MSLSAAATAVLERFSGCHNWEQRARLLLWHATTLPTMDEPLRTNENLVSGCESKVWLVAEQQQGHWQFQANSEARLISGLLAVLLARVNGLTSAELLQLDLAHWYGQLGLARHLSPSRSNGLNAVLQRMRELAVS